MCIGRRPGGRRCRSDTAHVAGDPREIPGEQPHVAGWPDWHRRIEGHGDYRVLAAESPGVAHPRSDWQHGGGESLLGFEPDDHLELSPRTPAEARVAA